MATKCSNCGHSLKDVYYSEDELIEIEKEEKKKRKENEKRWKEEERVRKAEREAYLQTHPWARKDEIKEKFGYSTPDWLMAITGFAVSFGSAYYFSSSQELIAKIIATFIFGALYGFPAAILWTCVRDLIPKLFYKYTTSQKIYNFLMTSKCIVILSIIICICISIAFWEFLIPLLWHKIATYIN